MSFFGATLEGHLGCKRDPGLPCAVELLTPTALVFAPQSDPLAPLGKFGASQLEHPDSIPLGFIGARSKGAASAESPWGITALAATAGTTRHRWGPRGPPY